MKLFQSIRWRLVASYVFLTLLTVSLVGVLALSLVKRYTNRQETDYLTANAQAVARRAQPLLWAGQYRTVALRELAVTASFLGNAQVKILDDEGQILADSGPQDGGGDYFVWISPTAEDRLRWVAEDGAEDRFFFESLVPGLGTNLPSIVIVSNGLPISPDNFTESLPPGTEFTIGRRAGGVWGNRFIFDDAQIIEPQIIELQPDAAGRGVRVQLQGGTVFSSEQDFDQEKGEAVVDNILETPTTDQTLATESAPARSEQVITVPIQLSSEATRIMGFVEISNGPNFGAEAVATTGRAFLLAAIGASILAAFVGLFVSRSLTAPLQDLTETAGAMSAGNLSIRASVQRQDEIGQLAHQFNQMAIHLERSFTELAAERDTLRRFITDASHEFRTPITALKNFNELLQDVAAEDPAARAEFLAESEGQINRLEWITHNLLDLSRFDAGLVSLDIDTIDLSDLLEAAIVPFKASAREKHIMLEVNGPTTPLSFQGDRARLEVALANLLDNALRLTPYGGAIEIGGQPDPDSGPGSSIRIWVKDTGPGIHPEDQAHLFERFYRGRNNHGQGSGLGLAIVQSIVQAHGGSVLVESNISDNQTENAAFNGNKIDIGSCFTLILPDQTRL